MTTTVNHIHYPDHDTYFFDDMLWDGTGCVDNNIVMMTLPTFVLLSAE